MTIKRGPHIWRNGCEQYLEAHAASIRSDKSRQSIREHCRWLHEHFEPHKRVEEYTEADLVSFLNAHPHWAGGTVKLVRVHLQGFFAWANWAGLTERNPAVYLNKLVRVSALKGARDHHWLEPDEVLRVLDATMTADPVRALRDRVILGLGFYAGLRRMEIGHLTWAGVRRDSLAVYGKGEKAAEAPLLPQLRELLVPWRSMYAEAIGAEPLHQPVVCRFRHTIRATSFGHIGEHLTMPCWGEPISDSGISQIVRAHGRAAGFPQLSPHDMRRSFAGMLQERNVPVDQIQKALRHESVATTSHYLSKSPNRMLAALSEIRL